MFQVGLPKGSVAQKMVTEGAVPTLQLAMEILSMDPDGPVPNLEVKVAEAVAAAATAVTNDGVSPIVSEGGSANDEKIPVGEHPVYVKYFKMLKVGLPKDAVKAKMTQEGVDPDILDKDPTELVSKIDSKVAGTRSDHGKMVAVSEHPKYSKYFRMLKVGLPKPAVKAKMTQEGVDPSFLDKDPDTLIALEAEGAMVAVGEHPKYVKFFKMLKVGLPKDAVKAKMEQEGVNPSFLDKDPEELVLLDDNVAGKSITKNSPVKKEPKVAAQRCYLSFQVHLSILL